MALETMKDDVKVIQGLSDYPNQEEGLTSGQMKAKFDEAAVKLQNYINQSVVPAVNDKLSASEMAGAVADAVEKTLGSITPAKIGAAPAGFGLNNDLKTARTPAEVDAFKTSGWYRYITSAGETLLPGFDILYAGIRVDSYSAGDITVQTIYPTAPHQGYLLRRYFINGAWTAFEWENPPMDVGVEYRTTEKYNGKAVYVKSVSVGKLTNGTNVKITGVSEAGAVRAMAKAGGYTAPFYSNATLVFGYSLGPTTGGVNVGLYSNGTLDALNVTVTIWYTKD